MKKLCVPVGMLLYVVPIQAGENANNAQSNPRAGEKVQQNACYIHRDSSRIGNSDVLQGAIQGVFSGVNVISSDGAPNSAYQVLVRGTNFIKGNNEPLYILDGVILNSSRAYQVSSLYEDKNDYESLQNLLSAVNPLDIESVEILKDASATALYGSRGANGVVIIKTKQGSTSQPQVKLVSNVSFSNRSKSIDMLDFKSYSDYIFEKTATKVDPARQAVNWQDEITRLAVSTRDFVSVSGKTKENTKYYISGGVDLQTGIVDRTSRQNYTFRVNAERPLGKYAKMGTNFMFAYVNSDNTYGTQRLSENSAMTQMLLAAPYDFNADLMDNPSLMVEGYDDINKEYRIVPNLFVEASPTKWFDLSVRGGVDFLDRTRARFIAPSIRIAKEANGIVGSSENNLLNYNFEGDGRFHFSKGWGNLDATLGAAYFGNTAFRNSSYGYDIPDAVMALRTNAISATQIFSNINFVPWKWSRYNVSSSINYSYDDRYFVSLAARTEKKDQFNDGMRYYPAVNLAWVISNESFMKDQQFISYAKLRGGYGVSGNQNQYSFFDFYRINTSPAYEGIEEQLGMDPVHNPFVAFPVTYYGESKEYNLGLDFALMNHRIKGAVEVYKRDNTETLKVNYRPKKVNPDFPASEVVIPSATMNKGIDISLEALALQTKKYSWSISANASFNRTKVSTVSSDSEFLPGGPVSYIGGKRGINSASVNIPNMAPNQFYGFKTAGVIQTSDVQNAPALFGEKLSAGDIHFVDITGDGNVDNSDMTVIGNPNPLFTGGIQTTFTYGRFSLSAYFYGSYGNEILNLGALNLLNVGGDHVTNVTKDAYAKAWRPDNQQTSFPRINSEGTDLITDRLVEDGSFLRLGDLNLTYQVPVQKLNWIKGLNVSFSAKNLFVLTSYSGYDPEVSSYMGDYSLMGFDYGSYPRARTYTLGISATF
ncbi:MAG: SusC/RagA family TonB-linked outer membrane protein [Bacteroidales bacterium]